MPGCFHFDGNEISYLVEGDVPRSLINGFGDSADAAKADFWANVFAEAEIARERDSDPYAPLTERHRLALSLIGQAPTDHS